MTVLVIGIGQPLAGDDGAGIAVLGELRSRPLPAGVEILEAAGPSALVPLLEGARRAILVDAVLGGTPGEVLQLAPESLESSGLVLLSTHGLGVAEVLAMARTLWPGTACRDLAIVGVCIGLPKPYSQALSPAVASAVPRAADLVLHLLGG